MIEASQAMLQSPQVIMWSPQAIVRPPQASRHRSGGRMSVRIGRVVAELRRYAAPEVGPGGGRRRPPAGAVEALSAPPGDRAGAAERVRPRRRELSGHAWGSSRPGSPSSGPGSGSAVPGVIRQLSCAGKRLCAKAGAALLYDTGGGTLWPYVLQRRSAVEGR